MALYAKFNQTSFRVGDTIKVTHQFTEADPAKGEAGKTQSQAFEGIVMGIKGRGMGKTFTVRKIAADAVGVEKIWPLASPSITKIKVVKKGHPKRAKLNYLRSRIGRHATRVKTKAVVKPTPKAKATPKAAKPKTAAKTSPVSQRSS
ncbi:MAG: 50S ribosomal protein L19 [Candidatus Beckwithbacteria bacterium GW2011_GWB1_47_15]|uniref:50S ribosomal protein L19 n=1 Tax=Candidatus Beckwithbacteria bacterium GW2011_GWB1_47_15 TaxID=1618371 RepID=A0A0G1RUG8_9BACT|nr:MAG: 50S ribosomal protein L19, large subunit ribosomal protein L19 [Candidatus Beckwithbacteria bacterium GW2011_GWC1_49_16]KKU35092.1 MAG: 50S ribosomal protein L19 [Candidatus Beckwithbacteria bacterium GW2011_GWA1_46_30]KKU60736.1 MAG: 50S ribosomal protein L19 [Candidatus Beckwithbacteria bacterium GW2011_GWB1_47_15]KKU71541.1 MAG: 50S ribosomal protein L19 [Candidatus Beckwithbacteria bacterium GW2011_GWA2_47_25]KKW03506.1 MAG: 50S ribosomal protein L19 [Candidatus Beckwithbacteria bac